MEIIEVDHKTYDNIIGTPYFIYGTGKFNNLNSYKVDKTYYLLFKENKYLMGICGGVKDGCFYSPFSAPFGGLTYIKKGILINYIEKAYRNLISFCSNLKINSLIITLPPFIYEEGFIAKQINVLFRLGFKIINIDINHYYRIMPFQNYINKLWKIAKNNLFEAKSKNLLFFKCESIDEKYEAYKVIKQNRERKGYPLKMTWEQVKNTIEIIKSDFFICKTSFGQNIAASMIFYVNNDIIQVIYWGDIPEYSHLKTMNYFTYKIFEYYSNLSFSYIDVGPSSENSIPNFGLSEFKESIGCEVNCKFSLKLDL